MSGQLVAPLPAPATTAVPQMRDRRAAVLALARVEGRRLLLHPLFLLGLGCSGLILAVFADRSTFEYWNLLGAALLFAGLAPWTLLVAFLGAQRAHRDGACDIYRATPLPARTRTAAALLSLPCAAAAAAVLLAAAWLARIGLDGSIAIDGRAVRPGAFELAQGPLLVTAFGALGIALGRWLRFRVVGPLAMLALFAPPLGALPWVVQRQIENPASGLHGHAGWHLAFLAGVTLAAGGVALARDGRSRGITLLIVLGLAGAGVGYVLAGPYAGGR